MHFMPGYNCEALPNRDSLHYADLYGAGDARTFLRGTLRYRGFSRILSALCRLGLVSDRANPMFAPGASPISWRSVVASLLPDFAGYDVEGAVLRHLGLTAPGREEDALAVETAMRWLGLFSADKMVPQAGTALDALSVLMLERMRYEPGERDMVLLKHSFIIQERDGVETKQSSSLIVYGNQKHSAMARTVGTPAAIAVRLLLDEHVIRRGVLTPITPDIYAPMLAELQAAGIESRETIDEF